MLASNRRWNKVEHRLFCYITSNWEGQPLISIETAVHLIGSTTTTKGLTVKCILNERSYPIGTKVSDEDFDRIIIERLPINPSWNYVIKGLNK